MAILGSFFKAVHVALPDSIFRPVCMSLPDSILRVVQVALTDLLQTPDHSHITCGRFLHMTLRQLVVDVCEDHGQGEIISWQKRQS